MFVRRTCAYLLLVAVFACSPCYGDWESDANARIESIRKRNAEITIVDSEGYPVPGVNVDIDQVGHHFAFGTCIRSSQMSNTTYKNFILNHFNWAVCENDTKWKANEPTRDYVTYTNADSIYNWCNSNGIKMRGHCLFWEQVNDEFPSWVESLPYATYPTSSQLLDEVDERIDDAVSHFNNKFHNWDVDNEILTDDFFKIRLGNAGIAHMFQRAKTVDPDGGMFMNEYNGNSFGYYSSSEYVSLANTLIGLGATIDGLGIQGHLGADLTFEPENYYNNVLQPLAALNRPIWVTEFDASHSNETTSADNIEDYFRICFSHSKVEGIIMWGFMQGQMWRSNAYLITSGGTLTERGLRYEALMDEWTTTDSNTADGSGEVGFRGFHGTYEITLSYPGQTTEVHTIELEPGGTTALFEIETDIEVPTPDTTPPTPDPMTWFSYPAATGQTTITMTATTATDTESPPVRYYFECTNDGSKSSTWQTGTTYVASGLTPGTLYSFRVKARDSAPALNETGWSSTQSATTFSPDTTPPTPNPMTWATLPAATGSSTITMTATTAIDSESPPVEYYFECTNDGSKTSGWQSSSTYVATGLTPETLYSFRVKARDSYTTPNETGWSSTESATTEPPPTYIEVIGSWETGLTHAKESGYNRALIFIAHDESESGDPSLTSVTYGGQEMTGVIEIGAVSGYGNYVAAFILNETGISAATSGDFDPTWSVTPGAVSYTSVFLQNVNQTTLVGASDSAGTASGADPISTDPLSTEDGDMVILGATCGNLGSYTLGNGFTEGEGTDHTFGDSTTGGTGVAGYKSATGGNETPSADYSGSVNRQVIIGFVVQAGSVVDLPPAAPTGFVATAGNETISLDWDDNIEPDVNGYNVYRSLTSGSGYGKLNVSLVSTSDYTDDTVTNGIPYYYVVTAVDANGHESGYSNEDSATPDYQDCADVQAGGDGLESDLDGDCYVDYWDLDTIVYYWLSTDCTAPDNCEGADFEPTDGDVDFFDFSDFTEQWLQCNDPEDSNCTPNW